MENSLMIEEFIDNSISDKKLNDFLEQMKTNNEFNAEVMLRKEINEAMADKNFFEFKALLGQHIDLQMSDTTSNSIRKEVIKTWHMAAASFALILVVGGLWYILSNKSFSTDRLVSKYYQPAHPIMQVRSVELNSDDALKEAFNFYQQNDYKNALKYFNSIENQITAKFYSGVCYIELEQYDEAISSFDFVVNDKDNLFVEQAEWYLGLIYLMNNQKNQALKQFVKISDSKSYYADQAKEILKYLN